MSDQHFNPTRVRLKPVIRYFPLATFSTLPPPEGTSDTVARWSATWSLTPLQPHEGTSETPADEQIVITVSETSTPRGYV